MIRKTTPWQIEKRFLFLSLCCIAMVLPTAAQKKPVLKRDKFEYSFELPVFVEKLKRELTYPLAWGNSDIKNFDRWRTEARKKVFECMMAPPRPAAAFDMRVEEEEKREGYTAKRISFCINDYARVTAYLLVPDGDGPFPAINALHDHGAHLYIGKEKMVRPFGVEQEVIDDANQWAAQLYEGQFVGDFMAQHGYVVLSVDAPLWGERGREEGVDRSKYDIIAGNMMMLGRDLCAFMHYDDIYATDFLATLPCVDRNRIGCLGCSMGAYRAWMLAALTDRVKAAASVCWMTTTDVQMSTADRKKENGGFANCLPGLRQYLDYPHIASIACPKPMLFINGTQDHLFPIRGVEAAFATMHDVWKSQKADSHLQTEIWDIPHSCGIKAQQRILEFFDKELK